MDSTKNADSIGILTSMLRAFATEREWQKYHTPKNLIMALTGEVGELSELFQWLTPEEAERLMLDPNAAEKVRDEVADVATYCFRLADILGFHLGEAMRNKMAKNVAKYPVEKAKGHARKYTEL